MDPSKPLIPEHTLENCIGFGAYGEVWRARTVAGTWRAIKVVHRARFENSRTYEREYAGLQRVEPLSRTHDALVDILQIGRNDANPAGGYFYYVMELADAVEGKPPSGGLGAAESQQGSEENGYVPRTLATVISKGRRLPPSECAAMGVAIAEGLAHLHSNGLVHRDIKPSNLIFVNGRLKLADIGLVSQFESARTFVGTGGYIPPEGPGSPRADIYALGKVLYEMATGLDRMEFPNLPGDFLDSSAINEEESHGELNAIILRACAVNPEERHATVQDLRGELLLVQAGESVRRLRSRARLVSTWRRIAIAAVAAGVVGIGLLQWQRQQTATARLMTLAESLQRHAMEARELVARQNLYAVDMNLAQVAIDGGNYGRAEVLLASYIPQGTTQDLRGFEWFHYWHRIQGDNAGVLKGHEGLVSSIQLNGDGTRLYSCSHDDTVREWSLSNRVETGLWRLPGGRFMKCSLDATGRRIATEGGNPACSAWLDLATGAWHTNQGTSSRFIHWIPGDTGLLRGTRNFLFETNGTVEWTDLNFRTIRELPEAGGCAAFSRDGTRVLTGPWGKGIKLWSWPEMAMIGSMEGVGSAHALAISADGTWLAAGTREGRLAIFDGKLETCLARKSVHGNGVIWSVAFSPDGRRVATSGNDQTVCTWSVPDLALQHVYRGHRSEVWTVCWSLDGRHLISAGKDSTIRLWEANPAPPPARLTNLVQAPLFSPNDRLIALRHRDSEATIHDTRTLAPILRLGLVGELGGFTLDSQRFSLLTTDAVYQERRIPDGTVVSQQRLAVAGPGLTKRLLTPRGRWLISGLGSGKILLQSTTNGSSPATLSGHTGGITALAVSDSEEWLASGSIDQSARLWNLKTLECEHVYASHKMGVGDATFSRDTARLATGSWDDSLHLWNLGDHSEIAVLGGHEGGVQSAVQTPDGRTIAVLSGLGILKFWSVAARRETGHQQLGVGPHQGWLIISDSGRWIAVVDSAGELKMIEVPPAAEVQ